MEKLFSVVKILCLRNIIKDKIRNIGTRSTMLYPDILIAVNYDIKPQHREAYIWKDFENQFNKKTKILDWV